MSTETRDEDVGLDALGALAAIRVDTVPVDGHDDPGAVGECFSTVEYALRTLREQVEGLEGRLAREQDIADATRVQRDRAEARVAELEADRDRLDWLEANGLHMTWGVVHGQGTFREAIDAARRTLDTKGGE